MFSDPILLCWKNNYLWHFSHQLTDAISIGFALCTSASVPVSQNSSGGGMRLKSSLLALSSHHSGFSAKVLDLVSAGVWTRRLWLDDLPSDHIILRAFRLQFFWYYCTYSYTLGAFHSFSSHSLPLCAMYRTRQYFDYFAVNSKTREACLWENSHCGSRTWYRYLVLQCCYCIQSRMIQSSSVLRQTTRLVPVQYPVPQCLT